MKYADLQWQGWGKSLLVFVALVTASTIAVYSPALTGPFVFDDIPNILQNPAVSITQLGFQELFTAAFSGESGPLKRPLAMLTFALNHYFSGGFSNTIPFKLTNIAIHIVNSVLVYFLSALILRRLQPNSYQSYRYLPVASGMIWALHPIQVTSAIYIVQRMTELSATFVLGGILLYMLGRKQLAEGRHSGFLLVGGGLLGGTLIGSLAKENAFVLPLLILLIEWLFYERAALDPVIRRRLLWIFGILLLLPLMIGMAWLLLHPAWITEGYAARSFTLSERLLTQTRVLWFYIGLLFFPDVRQFSLFHDDIETSTGLLTPPATFSSILALIVVVVIAFRARKTAPILALAVFWYLAAHTVESGFIALEMAHEHRNYIPSIGPLFAATYGLTVAGKRYGTFIPVSLVVVLIVVFASVTHLRSRHWASDDLLIETTVQYHPNSARANAMFAELLTTRRKDEATAFHYYQNAARLSPTEPAIAIRLLMSHPALSEQMHGREQSVNARHKPAPSDFEELSADIVHQLSTRPLTANTSNAIRSLSRCISEAPSRCAMLYQFAIEWYQAILRNEFASLQVKRDVFIYEFENTVWARDYEHALATAEHASSLFPSDMTYQLMRANALILLGRFGEAEVILRQASAVRAELGQEHQENIDTLLSMLTEYRTRQRPHRDRNHSPKTVAQ